MVIEYHPDCASPCCCGGGCTFCACGTTPVTITVEFTNVDNDGCGTCDTPNGFDSNVISLDLIDGETCVWYSTFASAFPTTNCYSAFTVAGGIYAEIIDGGGGVPEWKVYLLDDSLTELIVFTGTMTEEPNCDLDVAGSSWTHGSDNDPLCDWNDGFPGGTVEVILTVI